MKIKTEQINFFIKFIILVITIGMIASFFSYAYKAFKISRNKEPMNQEIELFQEDDYKEEAAEDRTFDSKPIFEMIVPTFYNIKEFDTFNRLKTFVYSVDETAYLIEEDLQIDDFLKMDFKTELKGKEPKILIFHTHSQEDFIDSRKNEEDDTILGVGDLLAKILVNNYHIPVVHDVGKYDLVDGKIERGNSYEKMEPAVKKILEKYPSIEVMIDLHRDGVPEDVHFVTDVDGMPTAQLMFFNGITRLNKNGTPVEMPDLVNPYIKENLGFSLQMHLTANELYPTLTRKIYIKPYRYSLHMMPKSMLVEVGANTNTVQEAKNAMYPLAETLVKVLEKDW